MLTYTGNEVLPENDNSPSLDDIAIQLGRIVRFVGVLDKWWTVLHHVMVCQEIVSEHPDYWKLTKEGRILTELHALLHDAHEVITSDIPSPSKAEETKIFQKEIDRRIFNYFDIPAPKGVIKDLVEMADAKSLAAEAYVLGTPTISKRYQNRADKFVCTIVEDVYYKYMNDDTRAAKESQAVQDYLNVINYLIKNYYEARSAKELIEV